jgi:hypothetical protein
VVVVVMLVLYPASMGPYWWLCHNVDMPDWATDAIDYAYEPIWWASWSGPEWFRDIAHRYLHWWTSDA